MMSQRGGKRIGAGRKIGTPNILTSELRTKIDSSKLIEELQNIIFKNKGRPTTGEKINAIKILLNKVLPDVQHVEQIETNHSSADRNIDWDLSPEHQVEILEAGILSCREKIKLDLKNNQNNQL